MHKRKVVHKSTTTKVDESGYLMEHSVVVVFCEHR